MTQSTNGETIDHDQRRVPIDDDAVDIIRGVNEMNRYFLSYTVNHESRSFSAKMDQERNMESLLRQHEGFKEAPLLRSKRDITKEVAHKALESALYLDLQDKNPEEYFVDDVKVIRKQVVRHVTEPDRLHYNQQLGFRPHVEGEETDLGTSSIWGDDREDIEEQAQERAERYGADRWEVEEYDAREDDEDRGPRAKVRFYNEEAEG